MLNNQQAGFGILMSAEELAWTVSEHDESSNSERVSEVIRFNLQFSGESAGFGRQAGP
jgi:hypothetical protein